MHTFIFRFFIFWYTCGVILVTFNLIPPWLEWANSVFLVTAGIVAGLYFVDIYGKRFGIIYSLLIIAVSIYVEHLGVRYGILFGSYDYTNNFGLKIADTPVTIGFAWLLIMGCAHEISRGITRGKSDWISTFFFIICGGLIAVTMDLILDPVAFKVKQYWIWKESGLYYDIPFSNFLGWFLLAVFFQLCFRIWFPSRKEKSNVWPKRMALVYGLITIMFIIIALTGTLYGAVFLVLSLTSFWYGLYFWRENKDDTSR